MSTRRRLRRRVLPTVPPRSLATPPAPAPAACAMPPPRDATQATRCRLPRNAACSHAPPSPSSGAELSSSRSVRKASRPCQTHPRMLTSRTRDRTGGDKSIMPSR
uniref:Uncharacterized protein n=1 Tax=Arundo donax TaxID=35708 RepID=A0A0A8Y5D9_ARUDO